MLRHDQASAGAAVDTGAIETQAVSHPRAAHGVAAASLHRGIDSSDLSGVRISHYELVRRIGRGGMGAVYAARRVDKEFRKLVAIKFVKPGTETDELLLRFKNERQVLASLEHPNIARLLDGGTDNGVPYLVMEYVEGTPIDKYCSSHRLSVDERLKLFCTVCAAVQYAHQSLVIHRDIKPSNILVSADGTPKLLDFGIAKVLTPEYGDLAGMTAVSHPMTPDFASPEQVRGDPITTSTDIYALGVLLYELLTTQHPLRRRYKELGFERTVLEIEPERPSLSAERIDPSADIPEGSADKLSSRLRGDIDAIVLMALRKEPQRRYASVQHFADDINRYLIGAPVRAQRDTVRYRAKKFVRRHTGAVIAASAAILALIASSVVSWTFYREATRERVRAEARFSDVRELARFVLFDFDKVIASGLTPARKAVIEKATEYLDRLEKDRGADPGLDRELVEGYLKVGDLQGNLNGPNLGDREAAKASYDRALKILDTSPRMNPMLLARTRVRLADLLEQADSPRQAIDAYEKARAVFEGARADDAGARRALLDILPKLALVQTELGDYPAAERTYAALIRHAKEMDEANPGLPDYRQMIAYGELRAGDVRARMGNPNGLPEMERALGMYEELAAAAPHLTVARRSISVASALIGDVLVQANRHREAAEHYRAALHVTEGLATADPNNEQFQRDRYTYLGRLADALANSRNMPEARRMTRRLLSDLRPLVDRPDASEFSLWQYSWTLLTTACVELRDPATARRYAVRLVEMSKGQDPSALDLLARAQAGTDNYARAVEIEGQAVGLLPPGLSTDLRRELEANLARFRSDAAKASAANR